jgi:putative DNA primase/helicase
MENNQITMDENKVFPSINSQKLLNPATTATQPSHEEVLEKLLNQIKPIDYYEKAGILPGEKLTTKSVVVVSVDSILETATVNNWGLAVIKESVAIYNGTHWKTLEKKDVQFFLGKAVARLGYDQLKGKHHEFISDLMKQFLVASYVPKRFKLTEDIMINFRNGTLIINEKGEYTFRDFDPNDFLFYQLSFDFDPNAGVDKFDKFLNRVLVDEKDRMILAEYAGYIFLRNRTLKLEKSLILYGTGANGKSTFFDILYALLGKENITTFSLQTLTNESGYQRAQIQNKLLNYASEISVKMDSAVFKQLSSGEPVEARLPYGNPFIMEEYAKMIFNTNELPKDVEQNAAFFRRFLILGFDQTIPENERDPALASKIIEEELPGVFNWAILGMQRLLAQKGFTYSEKAAKAVDDYRKQSDSVAMFMAEMTFEPGFKNKITLKELYSDYKSFCVEYGNKSVSNTNFSQRLKRLGFNVFRSSYGNMVEFQLV